MRPSFDIRPFDRHMTARQIARRKSVPSDFAKQETNKSAIINFGKNSSANKIEKGANIFISDDDINSITSFDLERVLNMIRNPIISFQDVILDDMYTLVPAKRKMLHIAIYMNNIGHYSGGRYYLIWIAFMMATMGHKVTVFSDRKPFFISDFDYIDIGENRIEWICEKRFHKTKGFLNVSENKFDFILESPLAPNGFTYAKKYGVPLIAVLFESPNYISKFRLGMDSTEEYWAPYKGGVLDTASILMTISQQSLKYGLEWLEGFKGRSDIVYPAINTYVADRIQGVEEKNEIVFCGRHVEFKNPDAIVNALAKIDKSIRPSVNYIGGHSHKMRDKILALADANNVKVRFYANVTDAEKFHIIKRSKVLVFLSDFEGFGISPAEGIYCGKPAIVYDIPVIRDTYGDSVDYVKSGDLALVAGKIEGYITKPKTALRQAERAKCAYFRDSSPIPCLPQYMKKALRRVFYNGKDATITAGMIVLNGADTIKLALTSIYESVDKIIIVEGAVEDYAKNNPNMVRKVDGQFHSIDNTYYEIVEFPDPLHKIEVVWNKERYWKNKNEMQNEIAKRVTTDLYLKVDSDEIFLESDIEYLKRNFTTDDKLWCISLLKYEFWKDLKTIACGGQWDRPQARMWRWRSDFRHPENKTGFNYFIDKDGVEVKAPNYKCLNLNEKLCYHLGYCRNSDQIKAKINYYKNRGIENGVTDNYSEWKEGMPTNSTHPIGTGVKPFDGKLPKILQEYYFKNIVVDPKERYENIDSMISSPPLSKV